jgi:[ribosomal protein S18]-alanine N-acetyltransferase
MPSLNSIRYSLVLDQDRTLHISALSASDARMIEAVHQRCFAEPWTAKDFVRFAHAEECHGIIARIGERIAGFVVITIGGGDAEILTLAVDPEWRRYGVASAVLRCAMTDAIERGAEAMFLEVGVTNNGARTLYKQLGFARVGRRTAYYSTPEGPEDAIVMKRNLLETLPAIEVRLSVGRLAASGSK